MEMDKIFAALAAAQSVLTSPPKNREVEVYSKRTNSKYKFKYATLDAIIDHVRKPLTENGLWFVQTLQNGDGRYKLVTRLTHSSGQYIESETPLLVDATDNQAFGSALTYMRRYALSAILGVAADDDDDANNADGNEVQSSKERTPKPGDSVRGAASGKTGEVMVLGNKPPGAKDQKVTECKANLNAFCDRLGSSDIQSIEQLDDLTAEYDATLQDAEKLVPTWMNGPLSEGMPINERIAAKKRFLESVANLGAG